MKQKLLYVAFGMALFLTMGQVQITRMPTTLVPGCVSTTSAGTGADVTEDQLFTCSLPPKTLGPNRGIRITAYGTLGADANSKTPRVYFGTTALSSQATTGTGASGGWHFVGEVLRSGAATEEAYGVMLLSSFTNASNKSFSTTEDTSQAITIKVTGQNGSAVANDIVFKGIAVEVLK